jgi:chemotaxis protein CheD
MNNDILNSAANKNANTHFDGPEKYFDKIENKTVVKIYSGGYYTSETKNELIVTVLGSCIACCVYDPVLKIGGMNHFLLPGDGSETQSSARFGVNAMELLINSMLKKGSTKDRLQVKIFGGANMMGGAARVGDKNISFIKDFLKAENLNIISEDVGGSTSRRLHFYPDEGRALVRKINQDKEQQILLQREKDYMEKLKKEQTVQPAEDDVTLF